MTKPWDPFPIPIRGDLDKAATYEGLGRLIVRWEGIDFSLARIYSVLVEDVDGDALREYGRGNTVPDKLSILRAAMKDKWSVRRHNQTIEGRFERLLQEVEGFSERRNEFAHSILHQVSMFTFFQQTTDLPLYRAQFALIPAYHVLKRYNPNGMPKFMYTEENMRILLGRLTILFVQLGDFRNDLEGELLKEGRQFEDHDAYSRNGTRAGVHAYRETHGPGL